MNVLKKFAVSLTALTTIATLGIGSFSVSANELTKVNTNLLSDTATAEDKFIASYKNADEAAAAKYYIDNGISIAEAKEMMDIYLDGKAKVNASKNSMARTSGVNTNTNFYNGSYLSRNQHYGVVIADNGSSYVYPTLTLTFEPTWVSVATNAVTTLATGTFNGSVVGNSILMSGILNSSNTTSTPAGILEFDFDVVATSGNTNGESYSESTLYHKFTLNRNSCTVLGGTDTTFSFETYIAGDVDHDGRVTTKDSYYITNILSGMTDGYEFTYTDKNKNIAKIVNDRAMDANRDGYIGLADSTLISQIVE